MEFTLDKGALKYALPCRELKPKLFTLPLARQPPLFLQGASRGEMNSPTLDNKYN